MRGAGAPEDWITLNRAARDYALGHHRLVVRLARRAGIPLRRFRGDLCLRRLHLTILIEWAAWWQDRPKRGPEPPPPLRDELLLTAIRPVGRRSLGSPQACAACAVPGGQGESPA